MGGLCSKQTPSKNPYSGRNIHLETQYQQRQLQVEESDASKVLMKASPRTQSLVEKESPRTSLSQQEYVSDDEFYDGIPRYRRSPSRRSRSLRVSEAIGKAGSFGFERAVGVLDTIGSGVTKLNLTSGSVTKSNQLSILAFEVANTIVKGSNLMESLSKRSLRHLNEVIFPSEGVQNLVTNDMDEFLMTVASDKRDELRVFSDEVVRFGNRCKDPQWHNLDRFFQKRSKDRASQKQLKDLAESKMLQMMLLVQPTAELYQELNGLIKLEEKYQFKRIEMLKYNASQRGDRDNSLNVLAAKLKSQRKLVKDLKKKSLWSTTMEDVMDKLVDIVLFLNLEINYTFGSQEQEQGSSEKRIKTDQRKLGHNGLALHYANIILQIDSIVARSSSIASDTRDSLYQSLSPNIKDSLRFKLQSFRVKKELTVTEIQDEMEKTLHWLVHVAINTSKAHHGFGWVGEWGGIGSDLSHRTVGPIDVMQVQTLYHADKDKTEAYILDLLCWLNYLLSRFKASCNKRRSTVGSSLAHNQPSNKGDQIVNASEGLDLIVQDANCEGRGDGEGIEENDELVRAKACSSNDVRVRSELGVETSMDVMDRLELKG